jgi:hypothetical protein
MHNIRAVLGIGAQVGSFTVLCHEWWPEAQIAAVEPHPKGLES